jgi:hypothetical protein
MGTTVTDHTDTLQHEWVQMSLMPVDVTLVAGEAVITEAAPATSQVGCSRCNLPLHEGLDALCEPQR